jgi:hypothetical protein
MTKPETSMTEAEEFNAQVEAELNKQIDAELQAEMAAKRMEIARRLRREAVSREYDRINKRHPIQGPGDPVFEAARRKAMIAGAKADAEHMARVNSRPVEGSLAHQRSLIPGSEGFRVKPVGQR